MKTFWQSRSGNFAMMTAVILPALLAGVGLAVDTANIINAKSRLQNIVDSAVLAASQENASDEERRDLFDSFVASQGANLIIGIPETTLLIEDGLNYVQLTGHVEAKIGLYLMDRFGDNDVTVSATTFRSTKTLEIAMVLDNTGSMGQGGIDALKRASRALVEAVDNNGDPRQEVHIGVVPFVTAVNIKAEGFKESWIDMKGEALYNGWNFISDPMRTARPTQTPANRRADLTYDAREAILANWQHRTSPCVVKSPQQLDGDTKIVCDKIIKYPHHQRLFEYSGVEWKGCVEARPSPYNLNVTAPDQKNPDTLFVQYFAPSEPVTQKMNSGGNNGADFNNGWLDHKTNLKLEVDKQNSAATVNANRATAQRSILKYIIDDKMNSSKRPGKTVKDTHNQTIGPNRACPTPLTPLTTDMAKVRAGINAMQFWNGSGTNISEGLAWGWRLLSPGEPFAGAAPFDAEHVSKFLVLMSDGTNVSFGATNTINKSDYGSYGFLATPGAGTSGSRIGGAMNQGTAETTLNTHTRTMCTRVKELGVEVYTVLYNTTNAAVTTLFRECASRPGNFHPASNTVALEQAFARIGREVAALHLRM